MTVDQIKRISYIDIMKGIAIICVLAGHFFSYSLLSTIIWSFHMPLFIFLNGFFFKEGPIWPRIKKSWKAYMKPYFVVWWLLLIAETLIAIKAGGNVILTAKTRFVSGFWALASNNAPLRPDWVIKIGVIWFLNALFVGTVFQTITVKIQSIKAQLFVVINLFVIAIIQTWTICLPFGFNYGAAFLMWLWVGYYYSKYKKCGSNVISFFEGKAGFVIMLVIWICIIVLEETTSCQYNICWLKLPLYGLELLGAFSGIIVIMHISRYLDGNFKIIARSLSLLGRASLWVLCVHAMDIELFPKIFDSFTLDGHIVVCIRFLFDIFFALSIRFVYKQFQSGLFHKV